MPHLRGRELAWVALTESVQGSEACDAIVLGAARIAEDLIAGCSPAEDAVFGLVSLIVAADRARDPAASALAVDLASALLENVPSGVGWNETRGRLWALRLFAWLVAHLDSQTE
jgi:hypothetical protein